ncbi:uncharacterized protein ACNLHF_001614 [Anomaloglossus baeobatrachus]
MEPVVINILLLFFSLHIAAAIKCFHCHERNSDVCKQEEIECPEGYRCLTISEEYKYNGTYHSIYKNCTYNGRCDVTAYAQTNDSFYFQISTKCCDTDYCNYKFFDMPEYGEPKGSSCPSCDESNTLEECKVNNEIQCISQDDKCATFAATVMRPDGVIGNISGKGCMSPLACRLDVNQMIGVEVLREEFFICNYAPKVE